jgi:hypothetical protein
MPEIEVAFAAELPESEIRAITMLAGRSTPEAVSALAHIALDEWLQWLVADDRPASLTELSKRRIRALLEARLLPGPATAPVLALRARLTLGQARYIVSALELENPASGTEAAAGLARHLSAALAQMGIDHPETLTEAQINALAMGNDAVFDAPRAEANLAAATHEELLNEKFQQLHDLSIIDGFQPPKVTRRTDSYVRLSLRPHVAVAILRRLAPGIA